MFSLCFFKYFCKYYAKIMIKFLPGKGEDFVSLITYFLTNI